MRSSRNAWNKWGAEDERGALDFIGPDQVRRPTQGDVLGEHGYAAPSAQQ